MFFSCLTPFHEDICGIMVVTFHTSRWQLRVIIRLATMKITVFWGEIPVASMTGINVLVQFHASTFNPLFYLEDGSNRFNQNAHPVAGTNLASGCRQAEGYRSKQQAITTRLANVSHKHCLAHDNKGLVLPGPIFSGYLI
jgi:hypothetical protein